MTNEHKILLNKIKDFLEEYPNQRFGQALFNLGINEFKQVGEYQLRDIYGDQDSAIINRIDNQLKSFVLQDKETRKTPDLS